MRFFVMKNDVIHHKRHIILGELIKTAPFRKDLTYEFMVPFYMRLLLKTPSYGSPDSKAIVYYGNGGYLETQPSINIGGYTFALT